MLKVLRPMDADRQMTRKDYALVIVLLIVTSGIGTICGGLMFWLGQADNIPPNINNVVATLCGAFVTAGILWSVRDKEARTR